LVDFGSFSTAIKKGTENKEISISFRFQTVISLRTQPEPDLFDERSKQKLRKKYSREGDTSVELELVLKQNERTGVTYAALIEVTIFENKCRLECDENGGVSKLLINEQDLTPTDSFGCSLNQRNILPSLQYFQTRKLKFEGVERTLRMRISPFLAGIRSRIEEGVHGKTNEDTIQSLINSILIGTKSDIRASLLNSRFCTATSRENFTKLFRRKSYSDSFNNLLFAHVFPKIIENVDDTLAEIASSVRYVEPLRATAQRYYRSQDLAVDEIDSKGTNVAMYIDSLSASERERLNEWMSKYFGVEVSSRSEGGHVTLLLQTQESKGTGTNIADLGVGFSQMLPIVLQLWQATLPPAFRKRVKRSEENTCIVIEQPELHLHPAYQARIADVMLASIVDSGSIVRSTQIIAETHSPHLINRLGELISEGKLSHKDVKIIIFQDSFESGSAEARTSDFDEKGILKNWPFGFFEA